MTQLADLIPLLVKENRAKKNLRSIDLVISWKTIAQHLKTRSVDDIRNYWQLRVLPIFDSTSQIKTQWTEEDDLELLDQIVEQDLQDSLEEPIDFSEVSNERGDEENEKRWALLLKGTGSIMPGMRYSPTLTALRIKKLIETRDERYAAAQKLHQQKQKEKVGFINIVEYFKKHYN